MLNLLLSYHVDVNKVVAGETALRYALTYSDDDVLSRFLSRADLKIDRVEPDGSTPLVNTIRHGGLTQVNLLLTYGADPDKEDQHGNTPLCIACSKGLVQVVESLLNYSADPDKSGIDKISPLHIAILSDNSPIVVLLLKAGALLTQLYFDAATNDHLLPLQLAIQQGSVETTRILLSQENTDPNDKGFSELPLMMAMKKNDIAKVMLLLDFHADPRLVGANGMTCLAWAQEYATEEMASLLSAACWQLMQGESGGAQLGENEVGTRFFKPFSLKRSIEPGRGELFPKQHKSNPPKH